MNLQELKNFDVNDLNNVGSAPAPIRILLAVIILALVLAAGYQFHTRDQISVLESTKSKETKLKNTFERKYFQSANLEAFKAQLAEMELEFGSMIRQLPGKTEIPGVIVDISQTALASGLNIELFKPKDDIRRGFYAEKPIEITLVGNYSQLPKFSSDVAALPRIVTLHDVRITPTKESENTRSQNLVMQAVAKTYRYLDDSELELEKEQQPKGKSKRRKK